MIKIANEHVKASSMMRAAYVSALTEMAKTDERVCHLDADLVNCIGAASFGKEYPDRLINCGIAEANMVGIAAGMSAAGMVPFVHTFGCFASRRCFDQIFLSAAYAKLNVKILGTDPGITAAFNGGTHMPFEDIGLMRTVPGITILEPTDNVMAADLVRQIKDIYGVHYLRIMRKEPVTIYEEGSTFEIGKGVTLRDGKDVTIIASGIMVAESIKAADALEKEGISARVVNIFTIKPIDRELIAKCSKETGAIVTAENHNVNGGLGSAVAEVLCEEAPCPIVRIGAQDKFGEVGPVDYLAKTFNMTADDVAGAVKKAVAKK